MSSKLIKKLLPCVFNQKAAANAPFLSDSFNRPNSDDLGLTDGQGHAGFSGGDGFAWVEHFGTGHKIEDSEIKIDSGDHRCHVDGGKSDYVLTWRTTVMIGNAYGYSVRWVADNSCWVISVTTTAIRIYQVNPGWVVRAVLAGSWAAPFTVEITCQGSTISFKVDGADEISYDLATHNQTETKLGLWSNANGAHDFMYGYEI